MILTELRATFKRIIDDHRVVPRNDFSATPSFCCNETT